MGADVFVADEQSDHDLDADRWVILARHVLDAEGVGDDAEVSLLFVDEATIAGMNERFLGRNGPTDVLAFPIEEEPERGGRYPDEGGTGPGGEPDDANVPVLLGDVVVCPSVAANNAKGHEVSFEDELALLVVHGLLHLLGMDHEEDDEAKLMERRERELLARFHRVPS